MRPFMIACAAALAVAALTSGAQAQQASSTMLTLTRPLPDGTRFGMSLYAYSSAKDCAAAANHLNANRSANNFTRYSCS